VIRLLEDETHGTPWKHEDELTVQFTEKFCDHGVHVECMNGSFCVMSMSVAILSECVEIGGR
jgi:hypothetical protein